MPPPGWPRRSHTTCREVEEPARLRKPQGMERQAMAEEVEKRLASMGLELPKPSPAAGNYVGAVVTEGNLVFVSGHGPFVAGKQEYKGKVDSEVSVEEAYEAAKLVMLNCLRSLRDEIGSLDRVLRIVKLLGMVNSDPRFARQPEVINGASDLLTELFGDRGKHARSAVGLGALPFAIPVEIEMVVEIE
jgi:enamine deaminase RidA (YjgF/YER057c/UK114 family)